MKRHLTLSYFRTSRAVPLHDGPRSLSCSCTTSGPPPKTLSPLSSLCEVWALTFRLHQYSILPQSLFPPSSAYPYSCLQVYLHRFPEVLCRHVPVHSLSVFLDQTSGEIWTRNETRVSQSPFLEVFGNGTRRVETPILVNGEGVNVSDSS